MNKDILNILSGSHPHPAITDQQLLDYLAGKLPEAEKRMVELQLADSEFLNDAVEGLESIGEKKNIAVFVDQLNKELHQKLARKTNRKRHRTLHQQRWIYAGIILILALIIATWLLIVKYQHLAH
jgi:anti-sigma factor RsiW